MKCNNSSETNSQLTSLLNVCNKTLYLTLKSKKFTEYDMRALHNGAINISLGYIDGIIFVEVNIGFYVRVVPPFDMAQYPKFKLKLPGWHGYSLKILFLDATSKIQTTHTVSLGHKFSKEFYKLSRQQWKHKLPDYEAVYQNIRKRFPDKSIQVEPLAQINSMDALFAIYTKQNLIENSKTNPPQYLVFGESVSGETVLPTSCLSPYHTWRFRHNRDIYYSIVQMLTISKAIHLYNVPIFKQAVTNTNLLHFKTLYDEVADTKSSKWQNIKYFFIFNAYLSKFSQDKQLKEYLLSTGNKILVYASSDTEWGIGMTADNPNAENPTKWQGDNLVGFALMDVRMVLNDLNEVFD